MAPIDEGGFVELGSDVAVYRLEEEITDITPIKIATEHPSSRYEGQTFNVVGYGVQDNRRTKGTRKAGSVTMQAVSGKPMHKVFGTKEAYIAHVTKVEGEAYVATYQADLDEFWDLELLPDYEAFVGVGPNDAQPCSGDSGGPLLKKIGDEHVVFAVVSGSKKGQANRCSVLGEFYATLGPRVQDMIRAMTGPCEGVPVEGVCEGTVAARCVPPSEGMEKVTRVDCADLDQVCVIEDGRAACADPTIVEPEH